MLNKFLIPDTVDYMIAGYLVLTLVISSYIVSIYFRWKKTRQEYESFANKD